MISPTLPAELKAALDGKLQGFSRSDAARRSSQISSTYRAGGGSGTIKSEADALAYALARMPATYAAVAASLNALTAIVPDLAPEILLDVGAGPGTASWAAAEAFPSLQDFTLLDANATLSRLALELAGDSARLADCRYLSGDAGTNLAEVPPADIVIASYVIGELAESDQRALTEAMWAKARHALVVIEPGTPAGYARILALRQHLITAGAYVAAPCPHEKPCPLTAPDWCHFSQRLPRSQAHRQIKGAEVPFEDERFIYVALTRAPPAGRATRVLAPPDVGKAEITAKLCTPNGLAITKVPRRDKAAYASARRWRWGDGVMSES
ncbi:MULTISPECIES: small ribosomal subunit Rsm22 family protein [unclassified Bradyrhizobium]|uniref:small ribosomal subunit Rsm22 family protein n=1 Tax=unclassified Bradyrhizobium TaxID=2631580 RepID=UPI00247A821C|nr:MULTISPECIES: small ribosomal subunit Rsm22 family protein [unclassified Bradyrhizobium]WGR69491.1 small ribosomal subunit Rsm22 family protein [Bradyrhizobium sp. ISRA426]WGR81547.1 small ribosomal subunit Rsm22 family protein [Bradyrhizobium sp. ISRA430]WGR84731.1 small ribosomal subunit Rsm22 family protein [Bradyrhizobium sp. ISRA432]